MKKITILSLLLTGLLASCGQQNVLLTTDTASQITSQQVALCYGTIIQKVHVGYYTVGGAKVIKAKSNAACAFSIGNVQVVSWITLYKLVNGVPVQVASSTPTRPSSPNNYAVFLQANGKCVNGEYYSQVTFQYIGAQTWNNSPRSGRSSNEIITSC